MATLVCERRYKGQSKGTKGYAILRGFIRPSMKLIYEIAEQIDK